MKLSVEKVCFSYGSRQILHNISFLGSCGEVIALAGPNGCGKTTLLKCIGGLHRPESGEIMIDGKRLSMMSMRESARHIGYVPQDTGTIFAISVINAVLLGRTPYIRLRASEEDIEVAEQAIEQMGLSAIAFRMMNELSGGERQRAVIARALAQQPDILLLDEPTSSLDLRHQLETLEIVRNIAREKNLLVILSIHDLNLAGRFADRIIMIENGSLMADGMPTKVVTPDNIGKIYGVAAAVHCENGQPYVFPMSVI
ncbi:MAG: ABC transporter ATP-binding protein [Eubacteriales bacterium]|nr:ABC transporter ATP-binding protein [Eubacteriales bacterium]